MNKKVLTLGYVPYGTGTHKPFNTIFPNAKEVSPADIEAGKVDALVIWGGADISPTIYKAPVEEGCGATATLSYRDKVEVAVCEAAIKVGVPIIGICRGAQLVCALAGGKLYQDVSGHMVDHEIETDTGVKYVTSSIHHQMMDVRGMPSGSYKLIAWTKQKRAKEVEDLEPEIIYFPQVKGLAIQGHPEFMHPDDDFVEYSRNLIKQYLLGEQHAS